MAHVKSLRSVVERVSRSIALRDDTTYAVGQAVVVAFLTWLGAAIGIKLASAKGSQFVVVSIGTIVLTALIAFLARMAASARDRYVTTRNRQLTSVHEQLDDILLESQADLVEGRAGMDVAAAPHEEIARLTRALFRFLEDNPPSSHLPGERVTIETVFMPRSYLDSAITICAWANTDNRMPRSLVMRRDDKSVYDVTATAALFKESEARRPAPRLIEDTQDAADYQQLYERQFQRIRSTVVYPVLSPDSSMLGALVATADEPGYFRSVDQQYWATVFGLYARRLALHMLRIDRAVAAGATPPF